MSKINNVLVDFLFRVINYYDINKIKALSWVKSPNFDQQLKVLRKDENKINIAFIDTDFAVGGAQKVTLDVAKALPKNRFKSALIATECFGLKKNWRNKFNEAFDDLIDMRMTRNKRVKLLKVLSFLRPDIIVIVNSKIAYSVVLKIKEKFPKTYLIDIIHGIFGSRYEKVLTIECIENLDKRITVCNGLREEVLCNFKNKGSIFNYEEKVICIRNGTDIHPNDIVEIEFSYRNYFNIPHNAFVVLFVGAIAHHKNLLSLIDMAKIIKQTNDVHFLLVGEGPLEKRVNYEISKNDLSEMVHIAGYSDNVSEILLESDILILPSKVESMGLVILEAMARGKPTIVANVGFQSEIIQNNINGLLVEGNKKMVVNFVKNILRLKNDHDFYERIKRNALIKVEKEFDVNNSVAKYINTFEEIFSESRAIS